MDSRVCRRYRIPILHINLVGSQNYININIGFITHHIQLHELQSTLSRFCSVISIYKSEAFT